MKNIFLVISLILLTNVNALAEAESSKKISFFEKGGKTNLKDEPTYIKSNTLTLKAKERTFIYKGNVEVKHGDATMTCDTIEGKYDEKNQIETIVAIGNVFITKQAITAQGGYAVYTAKDETVVLTDNPELQEAGNVLTADRVVIFMAEDRSAAEGQVRVKVIKQASK